jgi:hypothetical protein
MVTKRQVSEVQSAGLRKRDAKAASKAVQGNKQVLSLKAGAKGAEKKKLTREASSLMYMKDRTNRTRKSQC